MILKILLTQNFNDKKCSFIQGSLHHKLVECSVFIITTIQMREKKKALPLSISKH